VLYESVGKLAGINVLTDPQGIDPTPRNYNLDLTNVTLEEALNYVALETHTFWKPISRNAIFVTQESDPKRQEYQDEIVKVFYIQNAGTTPEFNEIFNAVRTGARLTTGVFAVPSQNAIIARGSVDTIALVEKLVHDLDRPKAEVLIDVVVMEVNRTKTLQLGASLLGQGGLTAPISFTPRNAITSAGTTSSSNTGTNSSTNSGTTGTTTTGTTTTSSTSSSSSTSEAALLSRVGHLSTADYSVSLPSTIVNALLSDNATHVLSRPQLRATDGGKASLKIGEKIPYVSGSLNSAVATPGSIPYATTQFQQVDVGTNIDLQPHVNGTEDISMHVKVEISNVLGNVSIGGIEEPEIGQQVDEADIRMKDGEVSILGGLNDKENSSILSGFPGLTNIPVLGYIFGQRNKTNTDNQVLIALIPHILRAPDVTTAGQRGVLAGTERVVRVERRADGGQGQVSGTSNGPGIPDGQPQVLGAPQGARPQPPNRGVLPRENVPVSPNNMPANPSPQLPPNMQNPPILQPQPNGGNAPPGQTNR
jgi:general secretion pathway protein D